MNHLWGYPGEPAPPACAGAMASSNGVEGSAGLASDDMARAGAASITGDRSHCYRPWQDGSGGSGWVMASARCSGVPPAGMTPLVLPRVLVGFITRTAWLL